jgi:hypothetical protein
VILTKKTDYMRLPKCGKKSNVIGIPHYFLLTVATFLMTLMACKAMMLTATKRAYFKREEQLL